MENIEVLFATNQRIKKNKSLKDFVEKNPKAFITTMIEDDFFTIVKEKPFKDDSYENIRMLAGDIAKDLQKRKVESASIDPNDLINSFSSLKDQAIITAFTEGWYLGSYQFTNHQSKKTLIPTELHFKSESIFKKAIERGKIRADAVSLSRNLMNEIPSVLNPESFPKFITKEFENTNVEINVLQESELKEMEMNGIMTVGRGSTYAPTLVELSYCNDPSKPLTALVGKGVTFDTGGISLKIARRLSDMRMDMGGAAAVIGAMHLLAKSNAPVNVVALIPIVENMPDAKSLLPGDVIRFKNGKTVQVGNTDAEGRLILADALIRAEELNATYIIDIATLTGAIANALGSELAGVFGAEELLQKMKKIGEENGDFIWPMPLVDAYDDYLDSHYADFNNISSKGEAGAITAALFLRKFITNPSQWVHIDMAGVMEKKAKGYYTNEASGFGARLLADFAKQLAQNNH